MSSQALIYKTQMSVEEYLHTSFDGADREYLDGEVVERNRGNMSHGRLQIQIAALLKVEEARTGIFVVVEVRTRVTPTRYRIPDIAVYQGMPVVQVPADPPLVAIEVLSPDDRVGYIIPKLKEYQRWGAPNIWVADPDNQVLYTYGPSGLHEVQAFTLPEHGIELTAAAIFESR